MARIAGVDLPREKRVQVGLTYVYGIGQTTANKILEATGINPDTRVKDLTLDEEAKIRDYIDQANILVEGDLRRNVALDIKRLVEIQSFRGTRHRKNLPCRGQRTKTCGDLNIGKLSFEPPQFHLELFDLFLCIVQFLILGKIGHQTAAHYEIGRASCRERV